MSCCKFSCSPAEPRTSGVFTLLSSFSVSFSTVLGRGGVAGMMLMDALYVLGLSSLSWQSSGIGLLDQEVCLVEEAWLP